MFLVAILASNAPMPQPVLAATHPISTCAHHATLDTTYLTPPASLVLVTVLPAMLMDVTHLRSPLVRSPSVLMVPTTQLFVMPDARNVPMLTHPSALLVCRDSS